MSVRELDAGVGVTAIAIYVFCQVLLVGGRDEDGEGGE